MPGLNLRGARGRRDVASKKTQSRLETSSPSNEFRRDEWKTTERGAFEVARARPARARLLEVVEVLAEPPPPARRVRAVAHVEHAEGPDVGRVGVVQQAPDLVLRQPQVE